MLWPHRKAASPCGRSAALESRPLTRRPGREGRRPSGRLTEPASPRHKALVSGPLQPRSKARLPFCRHYWQSRVAAADGRCQASCRGQHTRPRCGIAAVARGDPPQQGAVGGPRRWRCRASAVAVRLSRSRFLQSLVPLFQSSHLLANQSRAHRGLRLGIDHRIDCWMRPHRPVEPIHARLLSKARLRLTDEGSMRFESRGFCHVIESDQW